MAAPDKKLTDKVAIVTGASGGIGRVVAKRLANDGFAIAVHYAGNSAKAESVVTEIKNAGGKAIAVQADVAKAADVENLFKQTLEAFGKIDVVVHSAGIMPMLPISGRQCRNLRQSNRDQFARGFFGVGTSGTTRSRRRPHHSFLKQRHCKSFPNYGPYIASKAGVEGLVRVLANELRGRNITVNAVAPGPIPTELFLKGRLKRRSKNSENFLRSND